MKYFNVKKFCIFSTRYINLFHLSLISMAIIWLNIFNLLTFVIGKHYVLWDLWEMALLQKIDKTSGFFKQMSSRCDINGVEIKSISAEAELQYIYYI